MCYLRVVLFVKGVGADPSRYKPNRDDSQWWERRDALVRCVIAFLFVTPSAGGKNRDKQSKGSSRRELVLLFDEDWSVLYIKFQPEEGVDDIVIPTEQTIIRLFKHAATEVGKTVEVNGLTCRIERSPSTAQPHHTIAKHSNNKSSTTSQVLLPRPTGMDQKRDILRYLQATCSIDFLRNERLNSSPDVILRKTNKKSLMQSWGRWVKESSSTPSASSGATPLEHILLSLLKPVDDTIHEVVAGILHESSDNELPYWVQSTTPDHQENRGEGMQVCLFLGAVRDMSVAEQDCLRRVCCCKTTRISSSDALTTSPPLLTIRLGHVPEFTSKVLSVVAFHSSHSMLGAMIRFMLVQQQQQQHTKKRPAILSSIAFREQQRQQYHFHFICLAPFPSSNLSADLKKRNRSLWCLVRCTVAALWRSRLAGQQQTDRVRSKGILLTNRLTIVFEDGLFITLYQDELVSSLAERHQAAPSEHQILKALCAKLEAAASAKESVQHQSVNMSWNTTCQKILEQPIECSHSGLTNRCLLEMSAVSDNDTARLDLARCFYSVNASSAKSCPTSSCCCWSVAITIPIQSDASTNASQKLQIKQQTEFCDAAARLDFGVVKAHFLMNGQDHEAASITMAQHFAYQNCLASMILSEQEQRQLMPDATAIGRPSKKKKT